MYSPQKQQQQNSFTLSRNQGRKVDLIQQQREDLSNVLNGEKPEECTALAENLIMNARDLYGTQSKVFQQLFREIVQLMADLAVQRVAQKEFRVALNLFHSCEKLTDPSRYFEQQPEMKLMILNHLGSTHMAMGKLSQARTNFEEALRIVENFPSLKFNGVTYSNLCAIESHMGQHPKALEYAKLSQEFNEKQLLLVSGEEVKEVSRNLAVSWHNIGAEEEHLGNTKQAQSAYKQAYKTLQKYQGDTHKDNLFQQFKQDYDSLKAQSIESDSSNNLSKIYVTQKNVNRYLVNSTKTPHDTLKSRLSSAGGRTRISSQNSTQDRSNISEKSQLMDILGMPSLEKQKLSNLLNNIGQNTSKINSSFQSTRRVSYNALQNHSNSVQVDSSFYKTDDSLRKAVNMRSYQQTPVPAIHQQQGLANPERNLVISNERRFSKHISPSQKGNEESKQILHKSKRGDSFTPSTQTNSIEATQLILPSQKLHASSQDHVQQRTLPNSVDKSDKRGQLELKKTKVCFRSEGVMQNTSQSEEDEVIYRQRYPQIHNSKKQLNKTSTYNGRIPFPSSDQQGNPQKLVAAKRNNYVSTQHTQQISQTMKQFSIGISDWSEDEEEPVEGNSIITTINENKKERIEFLKKLQGVSDIESITKQNSNQNILQVKEEQQIPRKQSQHLYKMPSNEQLSQQKQVEVRTLKINLSKKKIIPNEEEVEVIIFIQFFADMWFIRIANRKLKKTQIFILNLTVSEQVNIFSNIVNKDLFKKKDQPIRSSSRLSQKKRSIHEATLSVHTELEDASMISVQQMNATQINFSEQKQQLASNIPLPEMKNENKQQMNESMQLSEKERISNRSHKELEQKEIPSISSDQLKLNKMKRTSSVQSDKSKSSKITKKSQLKSNNECKSDRTFKTNLSESIVNEYSQKQQDAAVTIQRWIRALQVSKQNFRKLVVLNKKIKIQRRNQKIPHSVLVIQKHMRRYLSIQVAKQKKEQQEKDQIKCAMKVLEVQMGDNQKLSRITAYVDKEFKNISLHCLLLNDDCKAEQSKYSSAFHMAQLLQLVANIQGAIPQEIQNLSEVKQVVYKLLPLIYIQENQILFQGIDKTQKSPIMKFSNLEQNQFEEENNLSLEDLQKASILIQSSYRRRTAKQLLQLEILKQNKFKIIKKWLVSSESISQISSSPVYNQILEIKLISKSKKSNEDNKGSGIQEQVMNISCKFLGVKQQQQSQFNDLIERIERIKFWQSVNDLQKYIDIDIDNKTMCYSSIYLRHFGLETQDSSNVYNPDIVYNLNLHSIIKIQAFMRAKLIQNIYLLKQIKKERLNINFFGQTFICKVLYLNIERESYLINLFYQSNLSNSRVFGDTKDNQSPILFATAIPLTKSLQNLIDIKQSKQKLSQKITLDVVKRYGQVTLKQAELKQFRDTYKIFLPNLEQVMQQSINEIRIKEGKLPITQDPSFSKKKFFNKEVLRKVRYTYKSLVNICTFNQYNFQSCFPSDIGNACQRRIAYCCINASDTKKAQIYKVKGIKSHSQLEQKALLDFPSTEFSEQVLEFMKVQKDRMQDNVKVKPTIEGILIENNKRIRIKDMLFDIDLYCDIEEKQVIIVSQLVAKDDIIQQLIIRFNQLATSQWTVDELKLNMQELIIGQLRRRNETIYFDENKIQLRKQQSERNDLDYNQSLIKMKSRNDLIKQKEIQESCEILVGKYQTGQKEINNSNPEAQVEVLMRIEQKIMIIKYQKKQHNIHFNYFGSSGFVQLIQQKAIEDLQKMMDPILKAGIQILIESGIMELKKQLKYIIYNVFSSKLQSMLRIKRSINNLKILKAFNKKKIILLQQNVINQVTGIIDKKWSFMKDIFNIRLSIGVMFFNSDTKGVKNYRIDLVELHNNCIEYKNNLKHSKAFETTNKEFTFLENFHQVKVHSISIITFHLFKKWSELSHCHPMDFYHTSFKSLIAWLQSKIQVELIGSRVLVEPLNKLINLKQEASNEKPDKLKSQKKSKAKGDTSAFILAIGYLQRAFRRFQKREKMNLELQQIKKLQIQDKLMGVMVKRRVQKVNGVMYLINVYQKENIFFFDLIPFEERKKSFAQLQQYNKQQKEKKKRKQHQASHIEIKNSESIIKTEHFSSQKKGVSFNLDPIQQKKISFPSQGESDSSLKQEIKYFNQNTEEDEEQQPVQWAERMRGTYEYDQNSLLNTGSQSIAEYLLDMIQIQDDQIVFSEKAFQSIEQQPQTEISQGMISENSHYKDNISRQQHLSKNSNGLSSNLVNYHFQTYQNQPVIYNVVYTGKVPQVIDDNKEQDDSKSNLVQINVDLNELKKLYPSVDETAQGLMKQIGQQLIDGIRLGQAGKIEVDYTKINPNCIQLIQSNIESAKKSEDQNEAEMVLKDKNASSSSSSSLSQQQLLKTASEFIRDNNNIPTKDDKIQEKRKILLKQTKFFSKQKFLILINLVERKVKKIQDVSYDKVFEEYESLYQISCLNLSNPFAPPLSWEVSPEEIQTVSNGLNDMMDRARFIMRNIQIFSNKIIFTVPEKKHLSKIKQFPYLVVFHKTGLVKIQNNFRQRKWKKNFNLYKEEILRRRMEIVHRLIPEELKRQNESFLLVCFSKSNDKEFWELVCWNMTTYERYSHDLKSAFLKVFCIEFGYEVAINYLAKCIDIDQSASKMIIIPNVQEYFQKGREQLKKQRLLFEQKKKKNN